MPIKQAELYGFVYLGTPITQELQQSIFSSLKPE
jgi:hypothetical protein